MTLSTLVKFHGLATHEAVNAGKTGTSLKTRHDGELGVVAPRLERDALLIGCKISGDGGFGPHGR